MPRYLISFDDGSMDHISEHELQSVDAAAHAVVRQAKSEGIWVFGCGIHRQRANLVGTDGAVTEGPFPETKAVIGGFSVIDVPTQEDAFIWAARIAQACRCRQEVREIIIDPES